MDQIGNLVSSNMLLLCWISLTSPFEGGRKLTPSQNAVTWMAWNFHLNFGSCYQNYLRNILADSNLKSAKYNIRLKCNNTTPFLLNNHLLKWVQYMLDIFSTEYLLIDHEILTSLTCINSYNIFMKIIPVSFWWKLKKKLFWGLRKKSIL